MSLPVTATLCAIVKDERPYLVEWVAYHRLIGFDRLLVYSNDCSDGSDDLLDRMAAAGLVEHRPWPSNDGPSPQRQAYADALIDCPTRWIMFLDADEFLYLPRDATVGAFLSRFGDDVGAVAINWRLFGSGGQLWAGSQPVIQRFAFAAPADHHLNRHIKTIGVVGRIEIPGVHGSVLREGRYVRADGQDAELHRTAFMDPDQSLAQVNHYVVKSRAEYENKLRRGNANLPPGHPDKETSRGPDFFAHHDRNEVTERQIQHWLPAVKAEMARIAVLVGE